MEVVYVTVGTTKFDSLIEQITSDAALTALKKRGCKKLIIQYGKGKPVSRRQELEKIYDMEIEQYDFKYEPVRTDILNSSVTIGHAGAGTCMDILDLQKPGLLVTNESLMDNHQGELAKQMTADGFLYHCTVEQLAEFLTEMDITKLKKYNPSENMAAFVECLNKLMS